MRLKILRRSYVIHVGANVLKTNRVSEVGYKSMRAVFTQAQEKLLLNYVVEASKMFHGLSPRAVR